MQQAIRIGTRESQLAVWQATQVKQQLERLGHLAELVLIKSEGDIDLVTPLYAIGVQGVFTRNLDAALLSGRIDIAVHSMKDVPVQLAQGIAQAAVLPRASYKDLLVYTNSNDFLDHTDGIATIATSSIRRQAQWLHRYPHHRIENLRGNVNTRLRKVGESNWQGAIFAAAGLERIHLRPDNSVELDWMLPAPAQGAIMVVCRDNEPAVSDACAPLNDADTALCVRLERDFLSALMGGCSTPISALAEITGAQLRFRGNICSTDGSKQLVIEKVVAASEANTIGQTAAAEMLQQGAASLIQKIQQSIS